MSPAPRGGLELAIESCWLQLHRPRRIAWIGVRPRRETAEILLLQADRYIAADPQSGRAPLSVKFSASTRRPNSSRRMRRTPVWRTSADLVVGEAMLTMHSERDKLAIMAEPSVCLHPVAGTPSTS